MSLHVSLSFRERLDLAECGAWRRYKTLVEDLSTTQLNYEQLEAAAWEELESALERIKYHRSRLPEAKRPRPATRRGL